MQNTESKRQLDEQLIEEKPRETIRVVTNQNKDKLHMGTEEVLYNESQHLPEPVNYHEIIYLYILAGSELLYKMITSLLIISMLESDWVTWSTVVATMSMYYLWKIAFNLYFLRNYEPRVPGLTLAYKFDSLLSAGYAFICLGLYRFCNNQIDPERLHLYTTPHLILTFARFLVKRTSHSVYLPFSTYYFMEALQLWYISLKLGNPQSHWSWSWVLMFYYIVFILWFIVAIALIVVFVLMIIVQLMILVFSRQAYRHIHLTPVIFLFGVVFYVIWTGISQYYMLLGLHALVIRHPIDILKRSSFTNDTIYTISVMVVFCASITFTILTFFFVYLRGIVIKLLRQYKGIKISLLSFAEDFKMNIVQQSHNYFKAKKLDDFVDSAKTIELTERKTVEGEGATTMDTCIICCEKQSEVLIHPCGHSGLCKNCITECIKRTDECPHCKQKMEKIYLIYYDEAKMCYMAKGVINFKSLDD